jgi:hypothetical protein
MKFLIYLLPNLTAQWLVNTVYEIKRIYKRLSTAEKLFERKNKGSDLENRDYGRRGPAELTT